MNTKINNLIRTIKESKSDDYSRGLDDGREDQAAEGMGDQVYGPEEPGNPSYMAGYTEGFESITSNSPTLTNRVAENKLRKLIRKVINENAESLVSDEQRKSIFELMAQDPAAAIDLADSLDPSFLQGLLENPKNWLQGQLTYKLSLAFDQDIQPIISDGGYIMFKAIAPTDSRSHTRRVDFDIVGNNLQFSKSTWKWSAPMGGMGSRRPTDATPPELLQFQEEYATVPFDIRSILEIMEELEQINQIDVTLVR